MVSFLSIFMPALGSNPIVEGVGMADPHMHVWSYASNTVYLYATHDCSKSGHGNCTRAIPSLSLSSSNVTRTITSAAGAAGSGEEERLDFYMTDWWVWSSIDLVSWNLERKVFPTVFKWDVGGNISECWATDAASLPNGQTFFYLSVGPKQIGVLKGATPTGPFHDPLNKPLIPIGLVPTYSRDPGVLMDDDGSAYLIFGTFSYYMAKLKPDMITLAETLQPVKIIGEQHRDDKPFLHKMNGRYYLSWGCWYAIGATPYGPFNFSGGVINPKDLVNTSFASGGGTKDRHGSFFTFRNQSYFACNDESHGGGGGYRSTIIAYAHYRANGTICEIRIDETGVGQYNLTASGHVIQAAEFYATNTGVKSQVLGLPEAQDPKRNTFEVIVNTGTTLTYPKAYFTQKDAGNDVTIAYKTVEGGATVTMMIGTVATKCTLDGGSTTSSGGGGGGGVEGSVKKMKCGKLPAANLETGGVVDIKLTVSELSGGTGDLRIQRLEFA